MPNARPISDMQRNIVEITKECQESQQPIYLTKNGVAALVIMDAQAFDREMALHYEVQDREVRAL